LTIFVTKHLTAKIIVKQLIYTAHCKVAKIAPISDNIYHSR